MALSEAFCLQVRIQYPKSAPAHSLPQEGGLGECWTLKIVIQLSCASTNRIQAHLLPQEGGHSVGRVQQHQRVDGAEAQDQAHVHAVHLHNESGSSAPPAVSSGISRWTCCCVSWCQKQADQQAHVHAVHLRQWEWGLRDAFRDSVRRFGGEDNGAAALHAPLCTCGVKETQSQNMLREPAVADRWRVNCVAYAAALCNAVTPSAPAALGNAQRLAVQGGARCANMLIADVAASRLATLWHLLFPCACCGGHSGNALCCGNNKSNLDLLGFCVPCYVCCM